MSTKPEPPIVLTNSQFQLVVVVMVCLACMVGVLIYVAKLTAMGSAWPIAVAAYLSLLAFILLAGAVIRCTPVGYRFRVSIAELLLYMTVAALCLAVMRASYVWAIQHPASRAEDRLQQMLKSPQRVRKPQTTMSPTEG